MGRAGTVILEQDHSELCGVLGQLCREANARLAVLIHRSGQQLASAGTLEGVDMTALASLTAGNVAATEGVGQLIGESRLSALCHEGQSGSMHISPAGLRGVLLVVFDERSSLGLVRLRVQQRSAELATIVDRVLGGAAQRPAEPAPASPLDEITDADIDALFG